MDWREFVETLSSGRADAAPRSRPTSIARMDFATRDSYRHAVERMARHSRLPEAEVASAAVAAGPRGGGAAAAPTAASLRMSATTSIDAGQAATGARGGDARAARAPRAPHRRPAARSPGSPARSSRLTLLLAAAAAGVASQGFAAAARGRCRPAPGSRWSPSPRCCCPRASSPWPRQLGRASCWTRPRALPRMDFSFGIPPGVAHAGGGADDAVSDQGIDALAEALEVRFLANRDAHLHFALLTDFHDAAAGDAAWRRGAARAMRARASRR